MTSAGPTPGSGRAWGCAIALAVLVLGLVWACTAIGSSGSGDEPYKGCSKLLPTDDFRDCINREGVWSGVD